MKLKKWRKKCLQQGNLKWDNIKYLVEEELVEEKENVEGKVQKRKEKEDVQRKIEDVQRKREEEDNYYYINNINYQYKYDLAYK